MAKIEMGNGFDEYLSMLDKLSKEDSVSIMKMAVYDGADIIADSLRSEINSWSGDDPRKGPTDTDRREVLKGLGIAKIEYKADDVSSKVGFNGYGHKTRKYSSKGVPITMLVRSIIAGTSFRKKYDFVGKVVRKNRNKVIQTMDTTVNKEIEKRFK